MTKFRSPSPRPDSRNRVRPSLPGSCQTLPVTIWCQRYRTGFVQGRRFTRRRPVRAALLNSRDSPRIPRSGQHSLTGAQRTLENLTGCNAVTRVSTAARLCAGAATNSHGRAPSSFSGELTWVRSAKRVIAPGGRFPRRCSRAWFMPLLRPEPLPCLLARDDGIPFDPRYIELPVDRNERSHLNRSVSGAAHGFYRISSAMLPAIRSAASWIESRAKWA